MEKKRRKKLDKTNEFVGHKVTDHGNGWYTMDNGVMQILCGKAFLEATEKALREYGKDVM